MTILPIVVFVTLDAAVVGTLGVLTGKMGELVLDRLPKNRMGFSGLTFVLELEALFAEASNLARPLATAPTKKYLIINHF